jgi:hypothetical protein
MHGCCNSTLAVSQRGGQSNLNDFRTPCTTLPRTAQLRQRQVPLAERSRLRQSGADACVDPAPRPVAARELETAVGAAMFRVCK